LAQAILVSPALAVCACVLHPSDSMIAIIAVAFSVLSAVSSADGAHIAPASTTTCGDTCTYVWFGEGCFWERQWPYANIELDPHGPFKRSNASVSSRVGYAGSMKAGPDDLVCYHSADGQSDYELLGQCENVRITLDASNEEAQYESLCNDFVDSFTPTPGGFERPDPGDMGSAYRVTVGIPGGVHGKLYPILVAANERLRLKHNISMALKADAVGNTTQDELNTVWVMDSNIFPFYLGEQYHQFHADFHPTGNYPSWYQTDLWKLQIQLGNIPKGGCPDGPHYMGPATIFM